MTMAGFLPGKGVRRRTEVFGYGQPARISHVSTSSGGAKTAIRNARQGLELVSSISQRLRETHEPRFDGGAHPEHHRPSGDLEGRDVARWFRCRLGECSGPEHRKARNGGTPELGNLPTFAGAARYLAWKSFVFGVPLKTRVFSGDLFWVGVELNRIPHGPASAV